MEYVIKLGNIWLVAKISYNINFHRNSFTSLTLLLAMIIATTQCNKIDYNYVRYLTNHFVNMGHNNFSGNIAMKGNC